MLFLLFQIDRDRFAIPASEIIEVLPLVKIRKVLRAPPGLAGIFIYRGAPVPVIDLSEMTSGRAAEFRISTRIILVEYNAGPGKKQVVGLLAERATQMLRRDPKDFFDPGVRVTSASYLGPVTRDGQNIIQRIDLVRLLSDPIHQLLLPQALTRLE
jgi:chemotaxis-related protein WspB